MPPQTCALHVTSSRQRRCLDFPCPASCMQSNRRILRSFKILQEFFRMVRFSGSLVFIQDDRSIRITLSGPIDPHVTFTVYRPSILSDHDWSLISLKYMKLIHLLMEPVIRIPRYLSAHWIIQFTMTCLEIWMSFRRNSWLIL